MTSSNRIKSTKCFTRPSNLKKTDYLLIIAFIKPYNDLVHYFRVIDQHIILIQCGQVKPHTSFKWQRIRLSSQAILIVATCEM